MIPIRVHPRVSVVPSRYLNNRNRFVEIRVTVGNIYQPVCIGCGYAALGKSVLLTFQIFAA